MLVIIIVVKALYYYYYYRHADSNIQYTLHYYLLTTRAAYNVARMVLFSVVSVCG